MAAMSVGRPGDLRLVAARITVISLPLRRFPTAALTTFSVTWTSAPRRSSKSSVYITHQRSIIDSQVSHFSSEHIKPTWLDMHLLRNTQFNMNSWANDVKNLLLRGLVFQDLTNMQMPEARSELRIGLNQQIPFSVVRCRKVQMCEESLRVITVERMQHCARSKVVARS